MSVLKIEDGPEAAGILRYQGSIRIAACQNDNLKSRTVRVPQTVFIRVSPEGLNSGHSFRAERRLPDFTVAR
jgi:hypothetical protein